MEKDAMFISAQATLQFTKFESAATMNVYIALRLDISVISRHAEDRETFFPFWNIWRCSRGTDRPLQCCTKDELCKEVSQGSYGTQVVELDLMPKFPLCQGCIKSS